MLPGERPTRAEDEDLIAFLRGNAQRIAKLAAKMLVARLGLAGTGVKRRVREAYLQQLETAARLLEVYGDDAGPLYGESQRRIAATRLSVGMQLGEVIEETAVLLHAFLEIWEKDRGLLPPAIARRLNEFYASAAAQVGDVFLTYQRAESVAFREAALLQTLVTNINEAIVLVERDGTIGYVSPMLDRIMGIPIQALVGESLYDTEGPLARMNLRDSRGNRIPLERFPARLALESKKPQHNDALLWQRPDGVDAVLEVDCAPIYDDEKAFRGVVLTVRDRTMSFRRQRELEAAYRELRKLHARLLGRTRLEAVGGLAQSAAHALNNQLNVITLRLERLKDIEGAEAISEGIERAVREIAAIVARLQELAAAPERRKPTPTDVNAVLGDALALTRSELEVAGIRITLDLQDLPPAVGERETLTEFFATLLLGATDVLRGGGTIHVRTLADDDAILVEIFHEGGVTLGEREILELFEPLEGGVAARTLSLAAGRNAIRRWGGDVTIHPREGGGNRFSVRLPRMPAEGLPVEEPLPPPPPDHKAERVVVIDDDPDNAAMLAMLVEDAGARAYTALSGERGIELAREIHPDAALVDLLLPDRDGWEVARALKAENPTIRLAVVSGLAVGKDERQEGVADEVFRKPVSPDELLDFLGAGG